eukprot:Gregarina_sp_Poly_1__2901@NODE_180_length_11843_cov_115_676376_g160_i0_p3_GENE_NODE_180_length_11843_cov_115_676376_g160_i0NODE_180_length_11843_cov_115_676376_g160_i0_p3_ORF_typecomplete_len325_score20_85Retrotrans_gag/PF03732_17/0_45Retrotrans_gag/PF03732_17/1_6e03_NODE_180_length_11843_cov_115_676376_g160_i030514025
MSDLRQALQFATRFPAFSPSFNSQEREAWFESTDKAMDKLKIPSDLRLHLMLPKLDPEGQSVVYRSGLHDWEGCKRLLRLRPWTTHPSSYLQIGTQTMRPNESLADYSIRLQQLASETHAGFRVPEPILAACFAAGVNDPCLRRHLKRRPMHSLEEAVNYSREWLSVHSHSDSCNLDYFCSAVPVKEASVLERWRYPINCKAFREVLDAMKSARDCRTVRDVRRLKVMRSKNLTLEEYKNILETPDEEKARFKLHFEFDFPFIYGMRITVTRPTAVFILHRPRLGRWLYRKCRNNAIITPGKWLAKVLRWNFDPPPPPKQPDPV